jgi:dienelactone hydrolase
MTLRAALLALLVAAIALPAWAAESVLTLTPRAGATLRVLVDRPAAAVGSVVLMAGGDGALDLDAQGNIGSALKGNHLVRTRADYAKAGYAVFVPDVASDQRGTRGYRFGNDYANDVAMVIAEARKVAPPVAIVGTSRGALSVAAVFTKQSAVRPDAAVISSGVLIGNDGGTGSASTMGDMSRINVPVMLLRHRLDACRVTPPADADRFKAMLTGAPKVDIVTLDGGSPRGSTADPCGAAHYHGFNGIDDQAVAATVQWLRANMRR